MASFKASWLLILFLSALWSFLSTPAQRDIALLADSLPGSGSGAGARSNILLLTAHPDDECMFFAPTLLALQAATAQPAPRLHSMCLSVGNADGLGDVRRRELARSLDVLGIGEGRRWVVDHPELQDNFTAYWDKDVIATVLRPYVLEHDISTILTFDQHGISSHPNHISLPRGVSRLLSSLPTGSQKARPRLFTLVTVPRHEKYLGLLSSLLSKGSIALSTRLGPTSTPQVTAVSSWAGYLRAHQAMREHWSQLVWFRWLYVSFSRYMWVNEWVEVMPSSDAQAAAAPEP